jgi:cyclopropane-fatty-acyl-phospholipid synthase
MDARERAARVVRTIVEALKPGFAVGLWNGERIGPATGPLLRINDSGAIRRLLWRPQFATLVELWISRAVDVENGSLFDIIALRPEGKLKAKLKALPKLQFLYDLPALAFAASSSRTDDLAGRNPFASGSNKEAIQHHYDISNDFYRLFLDERMVYSCGYFTDFANSIDQAQADKLEHSCRKLRLKPGERLLDIGCGWGAMLIHAVKNHGVIGHGVSLSEAQTALARERIRAEGLENRITIEVKSYLELEGSFDKISSIGMFEHIGLANHDAYFTAVHRLLKPGGIYLHHAITRRQRRDRRQTLHRGPEYRALVKYIFPGGEVDTIGMTGALCSDLQAVGRKAAGALRRGGGHGWRAQGAAVAALPDRLLDLVRAALPADFPDGGDEARAHPERAAADARRPLSPGGLKRSRLSAPPVLPVDDEVVDDGRIGQRRGIAECAEIVLGDLAQDAPHDLA